MVFLLCHILFGKLLLLLQVPSYTIAVPLGQLQNKIQVGDLIQVSLFERPVIDQAYVSAMEKKKGKNKITDDTQEIFPLRIPDFFLQPQEKPLMAPSCYFSWPGQDYEAWMS